MIGNDVVDLGDAETREAGLHPRFDERVFSVAERGAIVSHGDRTRMRWALWAAKEAAFKALRRTDPRRPFSPVRLAVDLGEDGHGVVVGEDSRHVVEVRIEGSAVHAVARATDLEGEVIAAFDDARGADPSDAVRRLALDGIASHLPVVTGSLEIETRGRVPSIVAGGDEILVSLAHHGSFVGFAARLLHLSSSQGDRRPSSPHPALSPTGGGWRTEECLH